MTVMAAEILIHADPTKADQDTLTLTCKYPIEREDNTPLAIDEIAYVSFWVKKDGGALEPAGTNNAECKQVYDLTDVADGEYVYVVSTTDTGGRTSIMSPDWVTLLVKRLANPRQVQDLTGTLS